MNELTITVESQPSEEERRKVIDGLVGYNGSQTGDASYTSFTVLLRDPGGEVVGGLLAEVYWGWLHVDALWVKDSLRGRGSGGKLMATAEREAVTRGCRSAFLDTFSFQALPFYERLGYEVFGELVDFPPGHRRYFLRKSLEESAGSEPPNGMHPTPLHDVSHAR
ncbi:MAG TPA: GNAT family N-acetyltransferase [Pyrinomonadaceae bacterium]|nr:GNAT family N-acetyltransferase [Pyrinomonadaceae bacterium]